VPSRNLTPIDNLEGHAKFSTERERDFYPTIRLNKLWNNTRQLIRLACVRQNCDCEEKQIEVKEGLLSFDSESFVFQF